MSDKSRAASAQDLADIVNQTLDEVEDLRAAIEYDEAYIGESSILVEPVSHGLTELLVAINDGEYTPGQGDWLVFLDQVREMDHRAVPFWPKLRLILETHDKGYLPPEEAGEPDLKA